MTTPAGIPKTMKALVLDRKNAPWEQSRGLVRMDVPTPVLDETSNRLDGANALIKVKYSGFCGSDRGIWFRRSFRDMIHSSLDKEGRDIRIGGHELFGEIVALGSQAARDSGLAVGDLVSTESHLVCGTCYQCRVGDNHVCADNLIIGISTDGCFAEYVKLPAGVLWRTDPKKIRPEVASLQEPFGNAVHACTKVPLRGKRVAIIGCGTIGLFAVAVARALGARYIIGVEPMPSHIDMARRLGADVVLAPAIPTHKDFHHDPELVSKIRAITDGVGVDVALEMSGENASINNAMFAARRGGDVILFGIKSGETIIEDLERAIMNGISMHSVVGRRIFETWHVTKNLLESRDPNIHDEIWNVILGAGKGRIVDQREFEPSSFEQKITEYPKVIIKWAD